MIPEARPRGPEEATQSTLSVQGFGEETGVAMKLPNVYGVCVLTIKYFLEFGSAAGEIIENL